MNRFRLAALTSLIAGIVILLVLALTAFIPLQSLFEKPLVLILWFLWILGVAAYKLFSSSGLGSSNYIRKYTPYSLGFTFMFIVMGILHQFTLMGLFLMIGYSFELVAGFILYNDFKAISGEGNAVLFLTGITLFILSLPLAIVKIPWPAIIGVVLKTISISRIAMRAGPGMPIKQKPRNTHY
ncbi:MAG: hypothetical protein RXO22_06935 [Thermocladium sp.]